MPKLFELDNLDRKLIDLVRRDNLEPARSLADKVGLSISAVLRRLRRLRESKAIIADVAIVDPALTGTALTMHVLVKMQGAGHRTLDSFSRIIARHSEVAGAWEVTGDDDLVLKIQVASMEEYDAFTRSALSEANGVLLFRTFITIRTIVEDAPWQRPLLPT